MPERYGIVDDLELLDHSPRQCFAVLHLKGHHAGKIAHLATGQFMLRM